MELQKRLKRQNRVPVRTGSEEVLIADARGKMRPGDFVEEKLRALNLEGCSTPSTPMSQITSIPR